MRHALAVATVFMLGLVAPAGQVAADERLVAGEDEYRLVGAQALELVDYPWRPLGWSVHFLPGEPGLLGLTLLEERRIEVYVRPGQPVESVAAVVAHEIAHVVDLTYYGRHSRDRWREARSLPPDTPWWPCEDCSDFATGAGDFAEVFAWWLVPGHWRGQLTGPPTAAELAQLLPLLSPRRAVRVR